MSRHAIFPPSSCYSGCYFGCYHLVICYDRRGYSRSTGEIDSSHYLEQQAADALKVLNTVVPSEKVTVVGCSVGGLISMKLAACSSSRIAQLILHEPAVMPLLPEEHSAQETIAQILDFIRARRFIRAANLFYSLLGSGDERAEPKSMEVEDREKKNILLFMEKEFPVVFDSRGIIPDVPTTIPCAVCVGDGHRENYHCQLPLKLAQIRNYPVVYFPGGHNCAYDLPLEFAMGVKGVQVLFSQEEKCAQEVYG